MKNIVIIGAWVSGENRKVIETIKNQTSEFINDASIITHIDFEFKNSNIAVIQDIFVDSIINSDLIICIPSHMEFSDVPKDTYTHLASYDMKCDTMTSYELTLARIFHKPIIYIDRALSSASLSPEIMKHFINGLYGVPMTRVKEDDIDE